MVSIVRVAEQRNKVKAVLLDATSCAGLKRRGVIVNAAFVLRPVPFFTKTLNLVEIARDNMGDLARLQLAFVVAKRADVNQTFGAAEQLGQKIVYPPAAHRP